MGQGPVREVGSAGLVTQWMGRRREVGADSEGTSQASGVTFGLFQSRSFKEPKLVLKKILKIFMV